jgi:hypothetical protein
MLVLVLERNQENSCPISRRLKIALCILTADGNADLPLVNNVEECSAVQVGEAAGGAGAAVASRCWKYIRFQRLMSGRI